MTGTGAVPDARTGSSSFRVWAPLPRRVELRIVAPAERTIEMARDEKGYWLATVADVHPGARYFYRLDGERDRPDPVSRFQPQGVHGPSEIVDHAAFDWRDGAWKGMPLSSLVFYELHVGTFTSEGTFDAAIERLDDLRELGVSAIELMPVAQFPGTRNWGYDGTHPYAVQNSYGGPEGLKRLVNACHDKGIAVTLDVVYNHLGPEGNYLGEFGPYFTDRYRTPWGRAVNYDGPYSDEVRSYFIENALAWVSDYHMDALRLDAVHGIFDFSAKHILHALGEAVHRRAAGLGRQVFVIPESDLNDARLITPVEQGGYGLDAQWNDDFHHCLHTLLTGERAGYYEDFGSIEQMEKALREGFVYSGQYSPFRKRSHGNSSAERPAVQFVAFSQNHDQVGNRMRGERLSSLVPFEALKVTAAATILFPQVPLLFMGEEYGETVPFLYFVSHSDQDLVEAVRRGRKEEFRHFQWEGEPPDPQDERTFLVAKLNWDARTQGQNAALLRFYTRLIALRKELSALAELDRSRLAVKRYGEQAVLCVLRRSRNGRSRVSLLLNFGANDASFRTVLPEATGKKVLDSADVLWNGPGTELPQTVAAGREITMRGHSIALYSANEQ